MSSSIFIVVFGGRRGPDGHRSELAAVVGHFVHRRAPRFSRAIGRAGLPTTSGSLLFTNVSSCTLWGEAGAKCGPAKRPTMRSNVTRVARCGIRLMTAALLCCAHAALAEDADKAESEAPAAAADAKGGD